MEENKSVRKNYKKSSRKKVCVFCQEKVESIDYKDVARLKKFITEGGKIVPRRMSGTCARLSSVHVLQLCFPSRVNNNISADYFCLAKIFCECIAL